MEAILIIRDIMGSSQESMLEGLSRLIVTPQDWKKSVLFIVLAGICIDLLGYAGIFTMKSENFVLPFFGIACFTLPGIFSVFMTNFLLSSYDRKISRDWSALLSALCVGVSIIFSFLPLTIFWDDLEFFFAISIAAVFSLRIITLLVLADSRFSHVFFPAFSQSLFAGFTGTIFFSDEFFVFTFLLQLFFGGGMFLIVWLIERPLKINFGVSALGMANAFMAHVNDGSKALDAIFTELGEEVFVPQVTLFFKREGKDEIIFTVPNVHPGPLGEIGGSNLPFQLNALLGRYTLVPHGAATHDFNPVSPDETLKIASAVEGTRKDLVFSGKASRMVHFDEKPVHASAQVFGDSLLIIASRSPEVTDDLDFSVGLAIMEGGRRYFKNTAFVDGHNSMKDIAPAVHSGSKKAIEYMRTAEVAAGSMHDMDTFSFETGIFAVKLPFGRERGFGDLGVQAFAVRSGGEISVYLLFDGNNMVSGLRERIIDLVVGETDAGACEVMTTDTHVVNIISGKNPVGGAVPLEDFSDYILHAVRGATDDLTPSEVAGSTAWCDGVRVFGSHKISQLASSAGAMIGLLIPVAVIILFLSLLTTVLVYMVLLF